MTVQEQIKIDITLAMLNKENAKRDLLRVVIGEFNREGKEVSDERAKAIIKKMRDNAVEFNNDSEVEILHAYLPSQLDEQELKVILMNYLMNLDHKPTMKDMGATMGFLKENFTGRYDGKVAGGLVRELISI